MRYTTDKSDKPSNKHVVVAGNHWRSAVRAACHMFLSNANIFVVGLLRLRL